MAAKIKPAWDQLPPEYAPFQVLAETALNCWAPNSDCVLKPLGGGASGAAVFRIDVAPTQAGEKLDGKFVLKLNRPLEWAEQIAENEAHKKAAGYSQNFANAHIPTLREEFPAPGTSPSSLGFAMLYHIAGGSFDAYQTADAVESSHLLAISQNVSKDILSAWVDPVLGGSVEPHDLLATWLGYRLSMEEAKPFHTLANKLLRNETHFVVAGEALLHPLRFCEELKRSGAEARPRIQGLLHGDLHGGNLLFFTRDPNGRPYQIIDFGLSKTGPMGFDHAYLELWALLRSLGDHHATRMLGLLRWADRPERRELFPDQSLWASEMMRSIRAGVESWKSERMSQRTDDVDRQFCLARVAAGINWANKHINDSWTYVALCYAGWAAKLYVERHERENLGHLLDDLPPGRSLQPSEIMDEKSWNTLLEMIGRFSRAAGRFVLVTEGLRNLPQAAALGQLSWSAIIDLDPDSEDVGLHHLAAPILQCHRGVHLFTESALPTSNIERGCAWMLAGGRMSEKKLPQPLNQWVTGALPRIRSLLRKLHEETTPTPLYILMLPGASQDPHMPMERLTRIADAAFEASQGQAKVIVLGHSDLTSGLGHRLIPLQVPTFLDRLYALYGTSTAHLDAAVPGAEGWAAIPIDKLRAMQEVLLVLHSRALDDDPEGGGVGKADDFWRGSPPTLHDLAGDVDIPRDVHPKLVAELREKLEAHTNDTVKFHHQPGAGGTTAAMRALWELRTEFPAAIIRKWSPAVLDRIRGLGRLSGKPVLLAVDATVLPDENGQGVLQDLHIGLRKDNCRAVILYLIRVLKEPAPDTLGLVREMRDEEPVKFCRVFEALTDDPRRQADLRRITHDPSLARYRSPFFYGLITFERDYVGIDRYVEEHLRELRDKPRTLIKYLALCTIYSNGGIPEPVCKLLRGQSADSQLTVEELLGEGPARLVVRRAGQWRLLHQVLAEEVLSRIMGSDWQLQLVDVATDLIRDLRACTDPQSEQVNEMLRELFVDRQGGGDDVEDRGGFSPLITEVTERLARPEPGKRILATLKDNYSHNAHFWNHLGRFQIYQVRSDYGEAEKYLEMAVQLSSGDRIHHTMLGIVRRAWMREALEQALSAGNRITAQELLERTRGHFDRAAEAFDHAIGLAREDRYAYICHIEMVISMATALKRAMGIESISDVSDDQLKVSDWLAENIALAETLLNEARRLYGAIDRNRDRLKQCEAGLSRLYGDMDAVIRIWEISESRGKVSPRRRRALAHAYLARGKRLWRQLSQSELRRIARLMDDNLRGASREEEDYRLWFEASMLLPEFDYDKAISNLSAWSQRWTSWRSHYYLYILYFLRWFAGRTNSLTELDEALENCSRLATGRKHSSEEWMATAPSWCPLISSLDLGPWDSDHDFWPSEVSLKRVNGIIKKIDGPQAGEIQIDTRLHIFFVPGGKRVGKNEKASEVRRHVFERNKDEESAVNFFLGFSPVGLRAWMVQPGRVEGGDRKIELATSDEYRPVVLPAPELPEQVIRERLARIEHHKLLGFAYELAKARMDLALPLTLDEVRSRIEAVSGIDALFSPERLGISNLENLLTQSGDFEIVLQGGDKLIRLTATGAETKPEEEPRYTPSGVRYIGCIDWYDSKIGKGRIKNSSGQDYQFTNHSVESPSRRELGRGRIVEFSEGGRTGSAVGVRVMAENLTLHEGKLLTPDELRPLVEEEVSNRVRRAADTAQTVSLKALGDEMTRMFPGAIWLCDRLGHSSFAKFIDTVPALSIAGRYPNLEVHLSRNRSFGRVPPPSQERLAPPQMTVFSSPKQPVATPARKYPPYPHGPRSTGKPKEKPSPASGSGKATLPKTLETAPGGGKPVSPTKSPVGSSQAENLLSAQEATDLIRRVVAEARARGEIRLSLATLGSRCHKTVPIGRQFPRKGLSKLVGLISGLRLVRDTSDQHIVLHPDGGGI